MQHTEDSGGPSPQELMRLLDHCNLSNSRMTTPSVSPSPSAMAATSATYPGMMAPQFTPQLARCHRHESTDTASIPQRPLAFDDDTDKEFLALRSCSQNHLSGGECDVRQKTASEPEDIASATSMQSKVSNKPCSTVNSPSPQLSEQGQIKQHAEDKSRPARDLREPRDVRALEPRDARVLENTDVRPRKM